MGQLGKRQKREQVKDKDQMNVIHNVGQSLGTGEPCQLCQHSGKTQAKNQTDQVPVF